MIDLNKIPPKILFLSNVIVIILLLTATAFLITETIYVKKEGGLCVNNPMAWAEKFAREERGMLVDCTCDELQGYGRLNYTGGLTNE